MAKLKKNAPAEPTMLRAATQGAPVGVDHERKIIRGFVVAQEGPFKSLGRGEFNLKGLREIVRIGNATEKGLRSRFQHPTDSDDGLGKYLGRVTNFRMDRINALAWDGTTRRMVNAVRGDLHLAESAFDTPSGDLGGYVMRLAEEDPDSLSSSLMIKAKKEYRIDKEGRPLKGPDGKELPPLWWPEKLIASDVVDTGDAVDGVLSIDDLPDALQRRVAQALDHFFEGHPLDVVKSRCESYLSRYLLSFQERFVDNPPRESSQTMQRMKYELEKQGLLLRRGKP